MGPMSKTQATVAAEGAATFVCGVCGRPVAIGEEKGRQYLIDVDRFEQVHGECLRRPAAPARR